MLAPAHGAGMLATPLGKTGEQVEHHLHGRGVRTVGVGAERKIVLDSHPGEEMPLGRHKADTEPGDALCCQPADALALKGHIA